MKTFIGLALGLLVLCGCSEPTIPAGSIQQGGIVIADEYIDYQTTFTVGLSSGRTLIATSRVFPWLHDFTFDAISTSYELTQPGDKYVFFDCENIADKIIDANLVKEIQPYCDTIPGRAKDFWKSVSYSPTEFTDQQGNQWKKVSK